MNKNMSRTLTLAVMGCCISMSAVAGHHAEGEKKAGHQSAEVCQGFGPQTPRDIDNLTGTNKRVFPLAPPSESMNLCNIHFHKNAEHKAKDFSLFAGDGKYGGYQCNISESLSAAELKAPKGKICKGLKPGDTIEVHWVHTSCDVKPGKGLGSCLSEKCANPDLRVETQVFTLVKYSSIIKFSS